MRCAQAPSLVSSSRPSDRDPAGRPDRAARRRGAARGGTRSITVVAGVPVADRAGHAGRLGHARGRAASAGRFDTGAVTTRMSRAGSTSWPMLAGVPFTVTRPAIDQLLGFATRSDAGVGQRLWIADAVTHRAACAASGSSVGSSSSEVSPKRSRKSKPVPYRIGRPGVSARPCSATRRRCSRLRSDVVRVDAADALDHAARHRLAVGDDGQRLERGRRQPNAVGADVAGDQRARLGRRDQLDLVAGRRASRMPRSPSATSRSPRSASTVSRSMPASVAISRRASGLSATNSSASSCATRQLERRSGASRSARTSISRRRPARRPDHRLVDVHRRVRQSSVAAVRGGSGSRMTLIGPHGSACSTVSSRPLASSSMARNVTATTIRSVTSRSSSCSTNCGAATATPRGSPRARSSSVIVRAIISGGGGAGGTRRPKRRARRPADCGPKRRPGSGRAPACPAAAAVPASRWIERRSTDRAARRARGPRRGTCGTRSAAGEAPPPGRLRRVLFAVSRVGAGGRGSSARDLIRMSCEQTVTNELSSASRPRSMRASASRYAPARSPSLTVRTSSCRCSMSDSSSASGPSKTSSRTCVASSGRRASAKRISTLPVATALTRLSWPRRRAEQGHARARRRPAPPGCGSARQSRAAQPAPSASSADVSACSAIVLNARRKPRNTRSASARTRGPYRSRQRPRHAMPDMQVAALAAVVEQAGEQQVGILRGRRAAARPRHPGRGAGRRDASSRTAPAGRASARSLSVGALRARHAARM